MQVYGSSVRHTVRSRAMHLYDTETQLYIIIISQWQVFVGRRLTNPSSLADSAFEATSRVRWSDA